MEIEGYGEVEIDSVCEGAAAIKFKQELIKVIKNIRDENTDPTKTRKIVMTFCFDPLSNRKTINTSVKSSAKLADNQSESTTLHIGQNKQGKLTMYEELGTQQDLGLGAPHPIGAAAGGDDAE